MLKKGFFFGILLSFSGLQAQETNALYKSKKVLVSRDTIRIENVSINSKLF